MSKIKHIQTGKCKLLAVMVPSDARNFLMTGNKLNYEHSDFDIRILTFASSWQIVGLSDQLTEEQCRGLVKSRMDIYSFPMDEEYWNYTTSRFNDQITAKCAFNSLLEANECYSVNPYREPNREDFLLHAGINNEHVWGIIVKQWQEAEENTGAWVILKQI